MRSMYRDLTSDSHVQGCVSRVHAAAVGVAYADIAHADSAIFRFCLC